VAITNGYCTLTEIKAALRITDSTDDTLLELSVESASRMIDGTCERVFYNAGTATRTFATERADLVQIDDCQTITTFQTSSNADYVWDTTWTVTDYQPEPLNQLVAGQTSPYTRVRISGDYDIPVASSVATVRIAGVWGYAAVPTAIKQACIIQASREFKRLDSPLGVAGFGDLGVLRVSRYLDPDVEMLVRPYVRNMHGVA
jgi:hypothetical protein